LWFLGANRPAAVGTTPPAPVASNAAAPAEAGHLSLVVLPFANLSNDLSQDYFADGLTENLTTDLSRLSGSFVIARNTAFTFKGKNVDTREIGKELGVRYVLEGSVQRDAGRMRVNVASGVPQAERNGMSRRVGARCYESTSGRPPAACAHTSRHGGFEGSLRVKFTGPMPQMAITTGSLWLRITPS
jgi:TolB-like protein